MSARLKPSDMRRLPVYLLLDTSGSMKGEPIEAVKVGLASLLSSLRTDPHALDTVHICLMTFDREVRELVPLKSLDEFVLPEIAVPEAGPTHTGMALREVCAAVRRDVIKSTPERKGDWRPLLFLMTDGGACDLQLFNEMIPVVQSAGFGAVVGCAAGFKAKPDELKKFCSQVVRLEQTDGNSFGAFFKWVSEAVAGGNVSMGVTSELELPAPPTEVKVVC